jgi:hypothetical protein
VTLFSAHGDVVVGFAIFHIVLFQKKEEKRGKRKEKCTPPWYVKVGGHPMESVSHGVGTPAYHLGFPLCIQFMIPRRPS